MYSRDSKEIHLTEIEKIGENERMTETEAGRMMGHSWQK